MRKIKFPIDRAQQLYSRAFSRPLNVYYKSQLETPPTSLSWVAHKNENREMPKNYFELTRVKVRSSGCANVLFSLLLNEGDINQLYEFLLIEIPTEKHQRLNVIN